MTSDPLAVKFDAYLEAMDAYERQQHEHFGPAITAGLTWRAVKWVIHTDEVLGYTTVADKLETVLEVGWYALPEHLRVKVERMQQALRNAESETRQQGELSNAVRLVVWVAGGGQYNTLKSFAVKLATTHFDPIFMDSMMKRICSKLRERSDLENEALSLTLAVFFEAFETYKEGHPAEFSEPFEEKEQEQMALGEKELDRALGYAP